MSHGKPQSIADSPDKCELFLPQVVGTSTGGPAAHTWGPLVSRTSTQEIGVRVPWDTTINCNLFPLTSQIVFFFVQIVRTSTGGPAACTGIPVARTEGPLVSRTSTLETSVRGPWETTINR